MKLIEVTDGHGNIVAPQWLIHAESVHRQLRPMLPVDYQARMQQVFANGARMLLAVKDDVVVGVALWRLIENTYEGLRLYIDDLVTDENMRSQGIGQCLLQHLESQAREFGCDVLALDSGVQRAAAHKFYFREGMHIPSFCFRKSLK
jgi:GNAT superfamily N-acetyltransferase